MLFFDISFSFPYYFIREKKNGRGWAEFDIVETFEGFLSFWVGVQRTLNFGFSYRDLVLGYNWFSTWGC
jgi:hypothetical protein